ncbi:Fur family ferric uptake transcriptional regulator [Actinopolyspora lacussalsi]|uniref:Fur family transcriptional regulator, ferric uptake regulator n=2 Tax=Actinopolyspora alba group TaxID=2893675 RepID=A0A1I1VVM3_9ACTN|nr:MULTISPECIES: Fur family transcriptional regulator [Actinopolyspora alba group]MDP9643520.1 Fur family ferric uptake transcriptional regulator [Actinopolyspora lacussalsi]SFD87017.1 Fur family transcriptional regulator, ferric uptake regulator [Actinopolyspora alba]SFT89773.1 Fur family transcriptional regulator, ferric uptake regulator [Actinopolyspora righensis]
MTSSTTSGGQAADSTRERLRAAGLRATGPRVAVLGWLSDNPHSTADQVAGAVRRTLGSVSTQAVYDVLHACTSAGLLRRIEPAGHPARFECRTADNHHHLVCRACGRAEDVDCVHGSAPCLVPSSTAGYSIDEAEIVFWGLCPDCASATD